MRRFNIAIGNITEQFCCENAAAFRSIDKMLENKDYTATLMDGKLFIESEFLRASYKMPQKESNVISFITKKISYFEKCDLDKQQKLNYLYNSLK